MDLAAAWDEFDTEVDKLIVTITHALETGMQEQEIRVALVRELSQRCVDVETARMAISGLLLRLAWAQVTADISAHYT